MQKVLGNSERFVMTWTTFKSTEIMKYSLSIHEAHGEIPDYNRPRIHLSWAQNRLSKTKSLQLNTQEAFSWLYTMTSLNLSFSLDLDLSAWFVFGAPSPFLSLKHFYKQALLLVLVLRSHLELNKSYATHFLVKNVESVFIAVYFHIFYYLISFLWIGCCMSVVF